MKELLSGIWTAFAMFIEPIIKTIRQVIVFLSIITRIRQIFVFLPKKESDLIKHIEKDILRFFSSKPFKMPMRDTFDFENEEQKHLGQYLYYFFMHLKLRNDRDRAISALRKWEDENELVRTAIDFHSLKKGTVALFPQVMNLDVTGLEEGFRKILSDENIPDGLKRRIRAALELDLDQPALERI